MIFQFTNKRPDTKTIWAELLKETEFSTEGIDRDLVRTMMWVILSVSKDFKKSKDNINEVLEGKTPMLNFRKSFIKSIASSTKFPGLQANPIDYTNETTEVFYYDYKKPMRTPFFIIKNIFKNSKEEALVAMLNDIFPDISSTLVRHVTLDMANHRAGSAWVNMDQTYASLDKNLELETENMFQKVLKIDIEAEPLVSGANTPSELFMDIKQYVLDLFQHADIQSLPITIPKITINNGGGNCEA